MMVQFVCKLRRISVFLLLGWARLSSNQFNEIHKIDLNKFTISKNFQEISVRIRICLFFKIFQSFSRISLKANN